jgi:L-fuculose-phosphate aldolase
MQSNEAKLRSDIVEVGRRLYQAGLVRGADGNFSAALDREEILITPSRAAKGFLHPDDLVVIDRQGRLKRGSCSPSLETAFHLAAYGERADTGAVIHAHPPRTIAFTVAGRELPTGILPELEILFPHGVPVIGYETPATERLADKLRPYLVEFEVLILDHHGILAAGVDVFDAWMKVEHVEACLEILMYAEALGGARQLPDEKLGELSEIRRKVLAVRTVRR